MDPLTMHHHGTPITPRAKYAELGGRCFCVSFVSPRDVVVAHEVGQSVMLDNGAFSVWKRGHEPDWPAYYEWCEPWLEHQTSWAVIPDTIEGDEAENNRLILRWPHGQRGAPVWHMHERLGRLASLCEKWPRVCIGSSGQYRTVGDSRWHRRMEQVFNFLCPNGPPPVWLHMLRGMGLVDGPYPFASVDSTDIAQNAHRPQNTVRGMAERWDSRQCPARWVFREQLELAGILRWSR